MQGRIVTAEDWSTRKKVTIIKIVPSLPGDARLIAKLKSSGERTLDVRFGNEGKAEMMLVIPDHVLALPDTVGRGSRKDL